MSYQGGQQGDGVVVGIVEHLYAQPVTRIVERGHGTQQAGGDGGFVVDRQLDGDAWPVDHGGRRCGGLPVTQPQHEQHRDAGCEQCQGNGTAQVEQREQID